VSRDGSRQLAILLAPSLPRESLSACPFAIPSSREFLVQLLDQMFFSAFDLRSGEFGI
jgi:hypothetical protein